MATHDLPLHFPPTPFTGERLTAPQFLKDFERFWKLNRKHPYMINPILRIHTMIWLMDGPIMTPWKTKKAASFGEELWTEYTRKFMKIWGCDSPTPSLNTMTSEPPTATTPDTSVMRCLTPLSNENPLLTPDTIPAVQAHPKDTPLEEAVDGCLLTSELEMQIPVNLGTLWPPLIPPDPPAPVAVPASSNDDNDWSDIVMCWEKNLPQYVLGPAHRSMPFHPRKHTSGSAISTSPPQLHMHAPNRVPTSSPCSNLSVEYP
ncbi:hypothetical protein EDB92DRAFT_1940325 [Lactarius akahatsu]|uniref:Uncharacterized protein n=1 Tax=Lactarius akahatsu TaxID=416441 RepID=A0AAD4QHE7_9AGAM|nr:hypothetical protein EDB92DRAFT_1940325 [Lactarius akahatsu]